MEQIKKIYKKNKWIILSSMLISAFILFLLAFTFYYIGEKDGYNKKTKEIINLEIEENINLQIQEMSLKETYEYTAKDFLLTLSRYKLIILIMIGLIFLIHGFKLVGK